MKPHPVTCLRHLVPDHKGFSAPLADDWEDMTAEPVDVLAELSTPNHDALALLHEVRHG